MQNKTKVKTGQKDKETKDGKMSKMVKLDYGHHVKVPVDPKEMFKMHVSHMIMKNLSLMK